MSTEGDGAGSRRSTGSSWLVSLTLALSILGVGAWYGWRSHARSKVAEISVEEYLKIKLELDEVRIEEDDLYGDLKLGYVVNNKLYKRIHVTLPPVYLTDAKKLDELKSGVDPSKFHMSPHR